MDIVNATEARKMFFDILKGSTEQNRIFRIQHRNGNSVLMSEEEYSSLVETLELLSVPDFYKKTMTSIEQAKNGDVVSAEEVFGPK